MVWAVGGDPLMALRCVRRGRFQLEDRDTCAHDVVKIEKPNENIREDSLDKPQPLRLDIYKLLIVSEIRILNSDITVNFLVLKK